MLARISKIEVFNDQTIRFDFNDGSSKIIDFKPFIGKDPLTSPLSHIDYFKQVKLYDRGRGIYWENGYDFCPDYLKKLDQKRELANL